MGPGAFPGPNVFSGRKKEELHGAVPLKKGCLLEHRTEVCTRDHAGIAAQPAGLDVGLGRNVLCLALGQHCIADLQRDGGVGDINGNGIPFLDQADGAAGGRLRADMADGSTAGCAGEAAVGDEGHCLIQLHACQRRGGVEHLPHARAALGAFVADDDHFARLHLVGENAVHGLLLRFVNARRAAEDEQFFVHAGGFDDAALPGDVARQHGQSAVAEIGVLRVADAALGAVGVHILIILRLSSPQILVNAAIAKQFIVRTSLGDMSVLHNNYLIAEAAGGQAVGNLDSRPCSNYSVEFGVDVILGDGVKSSCRLKKVAVKIKTNVEDNLDSDSYELFSLSSDEGSFISLVEGYILK